MRNMEHSGQDATDDTSIAPVSSLRSHFEQMSNSKPETKVSIPRDASPLPMSAMAHQNGQGGRRSFETPQSAGVFSSRGRPWEGLNQSGLRPPEQRSPSASPTRPVHKVPKPLGDASNAPAVNVEPPTSPPTSNLSSPMERGETSPGRHFRVPSRPTTPYIESRKTSQPPEPPPPRRSGEMRRESSATPHMLPPPVNRADKPKPATKPLNLHDRREREVSSLVPSSGRSPSNGTSPFTTPPSTSPEKGVFLSSLHSPRQDPAPPIIRSFTGLTGYNTPPPARQAAVRREQENTGVARTFVTPQLTGEPESKPALPARPVTNQPKIPMTPRSLSDRLHEHHPVRGYSVDETSTMRTVSGVAHQSNGIMFATPPKRIVSNPSNLQAQRSPPLHSRSMTVDRSARPSPETLNGAIATNQLELKSSRASIQVVPSSSSVISYLEYPNSSRANRRPPCFDEGPTEIATKYDTRVFDVCGEYVATAGQVVRVWSLIDGELLVNHTPGEAVKIVSLAFKAAGDVDREGSRLWIGTSAGELQEIDVATRSVVASRGGAHIRREVIKIYRYRNEMWTLDDGGTLHLWGFLESGASPSLSNPTQSFRLPKGHTFSMVIGHELWHATGKEIRVYCPTLDGSVQFQVLARPISQATAGEVTSGTELESQPDRIYFGHTDGKVTIYSKHDYACLGIINVSVYKINTLSGVGKYLWAGFNTGMLYVYDTTKTPWEVKKDWHAHENPVASVIHDRGSFWKMGRSQVISLGADNMLRVWDGMLEQDWLESEMQAQDENFCSFQQIKTLVMTWNAGASTPSSLRKADQDASFFPNLLLTSDSPDILVFGFQELVDLEDKKTTAKSFFKSSKKKDSSDVDRMSHQYRDWKDYLIRCLDDHLPSSDLYHLIHTASMVGLFTCIFVKSSLRDRIHNMSAAEVKRGMGGAFGNKGALVVRFTLDDSSLCFVNCHLAAGQTQTPNRNNDISAILEGQILPAERSAHARQNHFVGGGDGSMILDHEICVLNGDLNYRIDTMGRDTVVSAVKANNLSKLLERDQLLLSRRKNPGFKLRAFNELPITFAPTYKYDVGTDNYDTSEKKRSPAWCDRILYRGQDRIEQVNYRRHEVRVSDHRPVTGLFNMLIKTVMPKERARTWVECQTKFNQLRERRANDACLDYLANTCGLDMDTSRRLLQDKNAMLDHPG